MVIIGGDGVLRGEGDGFHACTAERGAVATADGIPDSARLFDKTEFLQGFVKHIAQFHIEFAHLRGVALNDLEVIFVGDAVDVDLIAIFEHTVVFMVFHERARAAETGFFASHSGADKTAVFRQIFGMRAEMFGDFLIQADARKVIHAAGGRDGFVVRQELRDEVKPRNADDGKNISDVCVPFPGGDGCGVCPQGMSVRPARGKLQHESEHKNRKEPYDAVNDFRNERFGVFLCKVPVPAAVVVRGQHDGIVCLA